MSCRRKEGRRREARLKVALRRDSATLVEMNIDVHDNENRSSVDSCELT